MLKVVAFLAQLAACILIAGTVRADPLTADAEKTVRGRWIDAAGERCDKVCAKAGATAENMLLYTSDGRDIYLCRVRKPPSNRFGNNYEDVCKVEDSDAPAGTALESRYECLCVRRLD